jgi:hypothetical protein
MIVILISGKAGAGKSTFAELLKTELGDANKEVWITHFADMIKSIALSMGWDGNKDYRGRRLLQHLGDVGKEYDSLLWLKQTIRQIAGFSGDYTIVDDFRFPYEAEEFAKRWPTITIRILRPGQEADLGEQGKHISENALEGYKHNYYLHNTRTLEDLANHAKMIAHILTEGRV